ncbi:AMP-binding enzyme [Rhodococcus artemisiae]|uniref:AMP-binding enzyme C-terminal domain-containing protein n=1 Tax=Rhodococcus artemisiae TaxID=714159 RepID=A0ABU7L778_9NOCA|nr:hypothetical protein [Rhodococcus artemisiae]MEE2057202.1 hypothetical protein [Rhodococcus artemisiae]
MGVPDPVAGQQVLLVAESVENSTLDELELYTWLTSNLPKHARPRYLILTHALPRTPTNKVLKTGLLDTIDLTDAWSPPVRRS